MKRVFKVGPGCLFVLGGLFMGREQQPVPSSSSEASKQQSTARTQQAVCIDLGFMC